MRQNNGLTLDLRATVDGAGYFAPTNYPAAEPAFDWPMRQTTQMKMPPCRLFLASVAVAAGVSVLSPNAASAACQAYRLLPKFAIKQSTGVPVTLSLKASRKGEVNGSAHYMSGSDFRRTVGEIEGGSFDGRVLKFNIVWSGSAPATYKGAIDQDGKLSGSARWGGNNTATFDSIQTFACRS